MSDYSRFRTPVIKLAVANTAGKKFIELPIQITKLLQGIEVFETIGSPCTYGQATLRFIEGSREPYARGTKTPLYNKDGYEFSNDTGMLSDLKFVGNGIGITDLLDVSADLVGDLAGAALDAFSPGETSGPKEKFIDNKPPTPKATGHVFSKGVLIKLTWGYLEDEKNQRSWVGSIKHLKTDYPETGQTTTEIIAFEAESTLDQIVPKIGKTFGTNIPGQGFKGKSVKDIVKSICSDSGFKCIISDDLGDFNSADDGRGFTWSTSMTLNTFLQRLASYTSSYYRAFYDADTGATTICFIRKNEFIKHVFLDKNLFNYKQPGSILKSVSLQAALDADSSRSSIQVNKDGSITTQTIDPAETVQLFKGESIIDTNPHNNPGADSANNARKVAPSRRVSGGTEHVPHTNNSVGRANAEAATNCLGYPVTMEFTSLGFTKLTTTTVPIGGLGTRFSGSYNVKSLTHIIDNTGYTCKGVGQKAGEEGTNEGLDGKIKNVFGDQGSGSEKVQLFLSSLGIKSDDDSNFSITDLV